MARITIEDCTKKVTNRFALVMIVAKRTKQIMKGSHPMVNTKDNKAIVTSLREVAAGKIWYELDNSLGSADEQVEKDLKR